MKKTITIIGLLCLPVTGIAQDNSNISKVTTPDLTDFSFLVGSHRCISKTMQRDGSIDQHTSIWAGQYILDGYAIADSYREIDDAGNTVRRGSNFRSYDRENEKWVMRWFDPEASSWMALGMDEKGGVEVSDDMITFEADTPEMRWKIKFTDISDQGFTWTGSASFDDAKSWYDDVQIISCTREE